MSNKLNVGLLYGGKSGEHEVSLMSACQALKHLDTDKYHITPIGINKNGDWFLNDLSQVYFPEQKKLLVKSEQSKQIAFLSGMDIDVIIPMIHGPLCEDGCLQGLLELSDVPYVGAGVLSSAVCMDKEFSKRLLKYAGLPTPDFLVLHHYLAKNQYQATFDHITEQLGSPFFLKPARLGSSVGVAKVKDFSGFIAAMEVAFKVDSKVIVEQAIEAHEVEFSVLEDINNPAEPLVSVGCHLIPSSNIDFHTYESKYFSDQAAEMIIPAKFDSAVLKQASELARKTFQVLDCQGMARVDLFIDKHTQKVYINEANTLPGFTPLSPYPLLWEASGLRYSDLLTSLINLAIARQKRKQGLLTDFHLIYANTSS